MKKLNRKGFTIVELVIVIAVIAILAAVLIPTMSNLIKTAQTSADVTLVKNVNLILATERATEGKNATMQEALDDAFDGGYDITKLSPTNSDNLILWDQESDNFVLYANGKYNNVGAELDVENLVDYKLWNISDTTEGSKYSVYYTGKETTVNVNGVGFDAGTSSVATVNYTNTTGTAKNVVIRTNSANTNLTIDAATDTVNHYGNVGKVDAVAIDMNCYNEYGTAAYVKVTAGKVVVKAGGEIAVAFVNNENSANAVVTVDGGSVEQGYTLATDEGSSNVALTQKAENEVEAIAQEAINEALENTEYKGVAISKTGETTQLMTIEAFRDAVNAGNTYEGYTVKLLDDINLGNIEWTPLKLFKGTFDGNNKTLSGLKLNESTDISSGYVDIGFFEKTENATIKNLTIDGFEIYGTGRVSSGTLVGNASNGLTLKNVIVTSTNKLTGKWAGGLMGRTSVTMDGSNKRDCKYVIDNCHSSVEIIGERTGGFVGQMDGCNNSIYNSSNGFATFTSCSFDGNVNANKGTAMAAGFVAQFTGGDRRWFVYTYQNCSVNDATIDSSGSKGDFIAVSQSAFSIFNCRINDENVILPTQVNFAFCNSQAVYAYSINGTIYAIKAANNGYYNVESDTIGVDAQVAGSSNHSISLSDTTDWHKVTNAYTDFYGNYIVSADASAIYRSVPTNLEEGTKLQRRTYVAGHDYSANQDTYGFDMWRIVNNDVEAEGTGFGQWQDVGVDGSTGFVLEAGIYYYSDPTPFVDSNTYTVSACETANGCMIYTVSAK